MIEREYKPINIEMIVLLQQVDVVSTFVVIHNIYQNILWNIVNFLLLVEWFQALQEESVAVLEDSFGLWHELVKEHIVGVG
jgi:hypothetical protein